MTPQTTLDLVRELSERAMFRPAPTQLRLTRAEELRAGPRRAIIAYEDAHLPKIGNWGRPQQRPVQRKVSKRLSATEAGPADWLTRAVQKTVPLSA